MPELRRDAYWHAAHEQALIRANDEEHGDLTAGKMQAQTHASPKRDVADAATQLAGSFDLDGFVNAIAVALADLPFPPSRKRSPRHRIARADVPNSRMFCRVSSV